MKRGVWKNWLVMAAGFVLTVALTYPLGLKVGYSQFPPYDRDELERYAAFSPFGPKERIVTIGSCEVSLPYVGNDPRNKEILLRSSQEAWFGNILNFIARHAYANGRDIGFYDIASPNTAMSHHTAQIYHALKIPGLKAVLYVAGLSLVHETTPQDSLEVMAVLGRLVAENPSAAKEIGDYATAFAETNGFKEGIKKYGQEWRKFVVGDALIFRAPDGEYTLSIQEKRNPGGNNFNTSWQYFTTRIKKEISYVISGPSQLLAWVWGVFGADSRLRDQNIHHELDWALKFHDHPENRSQVIAFSYPQPPLFGENGKLTYLWLRMAGKILHDKGIKLVMYSQPMLNITKEIHKKEFVPLFVTPTTEWLHDYSPTVIDHTVDHDLDIRDFTFQCPDDKNMCNFRERQSLGYWANIVGRYKQSVLLLEALSANNVANLGKKLENVQIWPGVSKIEPKQRCVSYVGMHNPNECLEW